MRFLSRFIVNLSKVIVFRSTELLNVEHLRAGILIVLGECYLLLHASYELP